MLACLNDPESKRFVFTSVSTSLFRCSDFGSNAEAFDLNYDLRDRTPKSRSGRTPKSRPGRDNTHTCPIHDVFYAGTALRRQ